jgi:hypothetical protein
MKPQPLVGRQAALMRFGIETIRLRGRLGLSEAQSTADA